MIAEPPSIVLERAERDALADTLRTWPHYRVEDLDGALLEDIASRRAALPGRLARALTEFARRPDASGALLVRGLPTDEDLPATPPDGRPSPQKRTRVSESVLVLVASVLGCVIGYREEKAGMLIHDVCPQAGREERQENSGSVYFDVHTENAFHPHRPDHVLLMCLRADRERTARTLVASIDAVRPLLSDGDVEALRRPAFRHRMPTSFAGEGDGPAYSAPQAVLWGSDGDLQMGVDAFNTVAEDDGSRLALERLCDALRGALTGPALDEGDLLIVDNRRAVHARTSFNPRYDGTDRWLQRVFVIGDLARAGDARRGDSHVLTLG